MPVHKATLLVLENKKGQFYAKMKLLNGKELSVSSWKPDSMKYHERSVEVVMEGGSIKKIQLEDGEVIYGEKNEAEYPDLRDFSLLPGFSQKGLGKEIAPDNFHLKFNKCAAFDTTAGKEKFNLIRTDENDNVSKLYADYGRFNFKALHDRVGRVLHQVGYRLQENSLACVDVKNTWRWVTGLGNVSVYENGLQLHYIYGIPYLPGSSVKGMVRSWIIEECFSNQETVAIANPVFQVLFGFGAADKEDGRQGEVVFFDAFPTEAPCVEPDIMNNHYQNYYEGKTPPADWLNPNPIVFLSIKGGSFRFYIGAKKTAFNPLSLSDGLQKLLNSRLKYSTTHELTLLQLAEAWLRDALERHGVGAKTAVGYGRMKKTSL